jgi:hypothetical protein
MFVMADSPTQNWFITKDARSKFTGILKEYLDCEWFQIRHISSKDKNNDELNDILNTQFSDDKLDGTLEFGDSKDNTSTWARAYDKTLY